MALWNTEDNFASVPAYLQPKVTFDGTSDVAANGTFTVPGHPYENGDKVKYTSTSAAGGFTTDTDYFVVGRTTDTLQLEASVDGGVIARGTANGTATDSLQQVAGVAAKGEGEAYFIDVEESGAVRDQGLGTAGWNTYYTYTDASGATRHKAECLVAAGQTSSAAGDAEDSVTVDSIINAVTINAVSVSDGDTATFTVAPTSNNSDAVFSYVWQFDASAGTPATNVTAGNHTDFAVAADGTLTFTAALAQDADKYHVVVTATFPGGATDTATSNAVALSVS